MVEEGKLDKITLKIKTRLVSYRDSECQHHPIHRNIANRKLVREVVEKAHRPRAIPPTNGLSGNIGSATSTLSSSSGKHQTAGLFARTLIPQKYRKISQKFSLQSAGTDLRPSDWASSATDHDSPKTLDKRVH